MIILPGLTTTKKSDWQAKVAEIDQLGLKSISLFPTLFDFEQRQTLYHMLEKTKLQEIPHVHIREQDTTPRELEYLSKRWSTKLYNTHPTERGMEFASNSGKFQKQIFVENTDVLPENFEEMIKSCGGLCVDFSHWHDYGRIQKRQDYDGFETLVKTYPIGCCHVNAIVKDKMFYDYGPDNRWHYNRHSFSNLSEFDYLNEYIKYFPEIISLELENSFQEQLKAKEYLEQMIINNQ